MTRRTKVLAAAAAALVLILAIFGIVLARQRLRRRRVFHPAPAPQHAQSTPVTQPGSVEQWSDQFRALETAGRWSELHSMLATIAKSHADLYAKWQLSYLDARALIEMDDSSAAMKQLAPYIAPGNSLRDVALFHAADAAEANASRYRTALIFETPSSIYRDEAIDDETEHRASLADVHPLLDLAAKLKRRDVDARVVERTNDVARGFALLQANAKDDAADRVARSLDRPPLIAKFTAQQLALIGDAMASHRHYDRAVALLSRAPRSDANTFDIGRAYFGDEKFSLAQQTYLHGAASTRDAKWKAKFLYHASRAAQLQGDDAGAEKLMAAVLAVPGKTEDHSAALTQRLRTRIRQHRVAEATADLNAVRAQYPKDHAVVEASLAYALGMLALGNHGVALVTLNAIPRNLIEADEIPEIDYWRERARTNAAVAFPWFVRPLGHGNVVNLKLEPFPKFPNVKSRGELLMAMGLFDDAAGDVPKNWSPLTQSLALNRGNAAHESIKLAEVLMKRIPRDASPPPVLRELLYPRYFYEAIVADSKKYGADPTLVISLMREESRFNPRAKSQAAARGLLQFIISTARDIGRDAGLVNVEPDDLYDPRIVIQLGAKYVSELSQKLGNDHYRVAAAYNAGPQQVMLWSRLQPAPGDDFFLSSINFDETKNYVRKVMTSYRHYEEIYSPHAAAGSAPAKAP